MHDRPSLIASGVVHRQNPSVNDISLLYALLAEGGSIDEYWEVNLSSLEIAFQVISQTPDLPGMPSPTHVSAVRAIVTFGKLIEARKTINSFSIPSPDSARIDVKRFLGSRFRPIRVIATYVTMRQSNTADKFPAVLFSEYPQFVPEEHSFVSPDLFAQYVCSYWFTSELPETENRKHKLMLAERLQYRASRVDAKRRNALFGFLLVIGMTFLGGFLLYSRVASPGSQTIHSWDRQSR